MTAALINNKQYTNATTAAFQAWITDVRAQLVATGWVQTADTGQINMGTVAAPSTVNTSMGYGIWRMADALQATAPVFMKIEYGSSNVSQNVALWLTFGQGSDGAGNLTGRMTSRIQVGVTVGPPNPTQVFYSGSTNRFAMAIHGGNQGDMAIWGIERTKNDDGTDSNEGLIIYTFDSQQFGGDAHGSTVLLFNVNTTTLRLQGGLAVMHTGFLNANDGSDVGVHPIAPPSRRGPENPSLNFAAYWRVDFAMRSNPLVHIYGADHTFVCLGSDANNNGACKANQSGNNDAMLMMRYE